MREVYEGQRRATYEPAPAATLYSSGLRVQLLLQLIQRSFGTRPKFNTAFAGEYAYSSGPFNSHLLVVSVFDLESQSNSTCIHEYEMYASTSLCLNDKRPQS